MAEAKQRKKEPTLVLLNVVRRQRTRLKRMQAPGRHRFKQYVGDVRLVRNRPRPVRRSFVEKHLEQLKAMEAEGTVEVRTESGQLVDLNTMKSAAPPAPKPQPKPQMDSVANDKPMGSPKPVYEEGKGINEPVDPPALATEGIPEGFAPTPELPPEPEPKEPEPEVPEPAPSAPRKRSKKRGSRKS